MQRRELRSRMTTEDLCAFVSLISYTSGYFPSSVYIWLTSSINYSMTQSRKILVCNLIRLSGNLWTVNRFHILRSHPVLFWFSENSTLIFLFLLRSCLVVLNPAYKHVYRMFSHGSFNQKYIISLPNSSIFMPSLCYMPCRNIRPNLIHSKNVRCYVKIVKTS
jgi:hypothetical protein